MTMPDAIYKKKLVNLLKILKKCKIYNALQPSKVVQQQDFLIKKEKPQNLKIYMNLQQLNCQSKSVEDK